jgi:hypothetical protein
MADEKNPTVHDERGTIEAITSASTLEGHLGHSTADAELARYANAEAILIDDATNTQLFWTVNKRILAVMLGVCACPSHCLRTVH